MSPSPHLIDVVIPAYNAGPFITQTLQSVLLQDAPIHNVIVVNDGSIDDTQSQVRAFQEQYPQLKIVLIDQINAGLSAARNAGIRHSQANYIALLDADDLWHPTKLSSQIALFDKNQNPQLGVVYCAYELINTTGNLLPKKEQSLIRPKLRGNVHQPLLRGNFISGSGSSVLIKRAALDAVGFFDEDLKACEDWEMWLRLARHYHFDFVDQTLVSIRVHSSNMQKDRMRMIGAEMMVLNKLLMQGEKNSFLLWKIRTFLLNKNLNAQDIPEFSNCDPKLQAQLSGWRMKLASLLLTPARAAANFYLDNKK